MNWVCLGKKHIESFGRMCLISTPVRIRWVSTLHRNPTGRPQSWLRLDELQMWSFRCEATAYCMLSLLFNSNIKKSQHLSNGLKWIIIYFNAFVLNTSSTTWYFEFSQSPTIPCLKHRTKKIKAQFLCISQSLTIWTTPELLTRNLEIESQNRHFRFETIHTVRKSFWASEKIDWLRYRKKK